MLFRSHGPDRPSAITQLVEALRASTALGVRTNQAFLASCLEHPVFVAGSATTAFIPMHRAELLVAAPALQPGMAALLLYAARAVRAGHAPQQVALPLAWPVPLRFACDGVAHQAQVQALGGSTFRVRSAEVEEEFQLVQYDRQTIRVTCATGQAFIAFAWHDQTLFVSLAGRQTMLEDQTLISTRASGSAGAGQVRAPMAGRIVMVQVAIGQVVAKGAPLIVLEAMKMEHPAFAPFAATVKGITVQPGTQVAAGTLLVELEATA